MQHAAQRHRGAWLVWSVAAIFYLYEYIQRVIPGSIVAELRHAFDLSATGVGNLAAYYFYAYALLQLPVGIMADRFGPKRPMFLGCILCVLGSALFGHAGTLTVAEISRFIIGAGSAFAYLCCLRLCVNWFHSRYFSMACGLVGVVGMLGAFAGLNSIMYALQYLSWRMLLQIITVLGVINVIAIALWVHDCPARMMQSDAPSPMVKAIHVGMVLTALRTPQLWLSGMYCGLMYAIYDGVADLWGINYLRMTYHLNKLQAAEVNSLLFLGGMVGSVVLGRIANVYGRRKVILAGASILAIGCSMILTICPGLSVWSVGICFFLLGATAAAYVISMTLAKESMPASMSGTTMGFVNTLLVIIGASSEPLMGYLMDWFRQHRLVGVHDMSHYLNYTQADFHFAFLLLPVIACLSLCVIWPMKESHGRQKREQ